MEEIFNKIFETSNQIMQDCTKRPAKTSKPKQIRHFHTKNPLRYENVERMPHSVHQNAKLKSVKDTDFGIRNPRLAKNQKAASKQSSPDKPIKRKNCLREFNETLGKWFPYHFQPDKAQKNYFHCSSESNFSKGKFTTKAKSTIRNFTSAEENQIANGYQTKLYIEFLKTTF